MCTIYIYIHTHTHIYISNPPGVTLPSLKEKMPQPAKWIQGKMTDPEPSADVRLWMLDFGCDSGVSLWYHVDYHRKTNGKSWLNGI